MFCFRGHQVRSLWTIYGSRPSNPIQVRDTCIHLSYICIYRIGETNTPFSRGTKSRYTGNEPIMTSFKQANNGGECLAPYHLRGRGRRRGEQGQHQFHMGLKRRLNDKRLCFNKTKTTTTKVVSKTKSQWKSSYQQLCIHPEYKRTRITTCDLQLSQTPANTM